MKPSLIDPQGLLLIDVVEYKHQWVIYHGDWPDCSITVIPKDEKEQKV